MTLNNQIEMTQGFTTRNVSPSPRSARTPPRSVEIWAALTPNPQRAPPLNPPSDPAGGPLLRTLGWITDEIREILCPRSGLRLFDIDRNGPLEQTQFADLAESGIIWNWVAVPA